jgi:hypothetical protein
MQCSNDAFARSDAGTLPYIDSSINFDGCAKAWRSQLVNDVFAVSNWRLNPWLGDPVKALLLSFHLRIRGLFAATRGVAATKEIGGTESGGKNGTPTSKVGR